jgi:hypothetical protein
VIRPRWDQEKDELRGCERSDTWLVEQLRCELASDGFDLAGEFALFGGQLQHASCDRAQREQCAAELLIMSPLRSCCSQALQQPCARQRPQLTTQRFGRRDQEVSQLAEAGTLGVHRPLTRGHQRPQCFAFAARARGGRTRLCEHAAGCADRVERVGLAARATLAPQPSDLEHLLAVPGQEPCQAGTERAGALNRERTPTRRMLIDELQGVRVALAVR